MRATGGTGWAWVDGRIVPDESATVSILDHGFLYGDSVYEAVRTWSGRPFLLQPHLERLERSAKGLFIPFPDGIPRVVDEMLAWRAGEQERLLRIILTRGVGSLGYEIDVSQEPTLVVLSRPLPSYPPRFYREGVHLVVVAVRRNPRSALDPSLKTSNLLNLRLAFMEARRRGADDALLLNHDGDVAEASGSNVFAVINGRLATPPVETGILQGITRGFVMDLAEREGWKVAEERISLPDLEAATEVFVTATTRSIMPVATIDGRPVGTGKPGPVTCLMVRRFEEAVGQSLCPTPKDEG